MRWAPGRGILGQMQEEKGTQKRDYRVEKEEGDIFRDCGFCGSSLFTGARAGHRESSFVPS